jgi:hypothetical protein
LGFVGVFEVLLYGSLREGAKDATPPKINTPINPNQKNDLFNKKKNGARFSRSVWYVIL